MTEQRRDDIAKLEALHAQPSGGRVFIHLAEAYRRAGDMERAREVIQDGLSKHDGYASAHVVHGRILRELSRKDEAADEFRAALDIDPHNLVALRALGEIRREDDDPAAALEYFQQLLLLDPADEDLDRVVRDLEASASAGEGPEWDVEHAGFGDEVDLPDAVAESGLGETPVGMEAGDEEEAWTVESWGEVDLSAEGESAEDVVVADEPGVGERTDEEEPETPDADAEEEDSLLVGEWATLLPDAEDEPHGPEEIESGELMEGVEEIEPADDPAEAEAATEPPGPAEPVEPTEPAELPELPPLEEEVTGEGWESVEEEAAAVEAIETPHVEVEDVEVEDVEVGNVEVGDVEVEDIQVEDVDFEDVEDAEWVEDVEAVDGLEEVEEVEEVQKARLQEPEPGERGADVETETMADLYAQQGLHEHAAEVYAKLLEAHPGDARLQERLEENRRLAAEPAARHAPEAEAKVEVEAEAEGEARAEGEPEAIAAESDLADAEYVDIEDLTVDEDAAEESATADAAEDESRPTVDEYFGRLMSWRPAEEEFTRTLDLSRDAEYLGGGPEAPDSQAPEAPSGEAEGDEEDLEVFRSWLQSLKR